MFKLTIFILLISVHVITSSEPRDLSHRRILSQKRASERQFPYMASIRRIENPFHLGCGTLISVNFVITAASVISSFKSPQMAVILLGTVDIGKNAPNPGLSIRAIEFFFNPQYPKHETSNDMNNLALIQMEKAVPRCRSFFGVISPIFIDHKKRDEKYEALIAGWGSSDKEQNDHSQMLRYANVEVVPESDCIPNEFLASKRTDLRGLWCVGNTTRGLCGSDIGGPLVTASGIVGVAVSTSCDGDKGRPDLFVKLSDHINWIYSIVPENYEKQNQ